MSWKLEGSYFETCSCNVVCPCTASLAFGATHERYKVTLVFNVKAHPIIGCLCAQRNASAGPRELEGVLQQVRHD